MASAAALLADLHGAALRRLSSVVGDVVGLTVAAREARRRRRVSPYLARKLERIDVAMHYSQHITPAKVGSLLAVLNGELRQTEPWVYPSPAEDPWLSSPDPWAASASSFGEAACVAQADQVLEALGAQHGVPPRKPPGVPPAPPVLVAVATQTPVLGTRSTGVITSRPRRATTGTSIVGPGTMEAEVQTLPFPPPTSSVVSVAGDSATAGSDAADKAAKEEAAADEAAKAVLAAQDYSIQEMSTVAIGMGWSPAEIIALRSTGPRPSGGSASSSSMPSTSSAPWYPGWHQTSWSSWSWHGKRGRR